jgi:hypothetical protein
MGIVLPVCTNVHNLVSFGKKWIIKTAKGSQMSQIRGAESNFTSALFPIFFFHWTLPLKGA